MRNKGNTDIDYTACIFAMSESGYYSGNYDCRKFERKFKEWKKRLEDREKRG